MGFSKEKIKQIYRLMFLAAALVLAIIHSNAIVGAVQLALRISSPFVTGGAIAFVLNLPMRTLENRMLKKWQGKMAKKLKRPVSIVLSIAFLVLIVNILVIAVVPQLTSAVAELGRKIPSFFRELVGQLELLAKEYPQFNDAVAALERVELQWDWKAIADTAMNFLKNGVGSMLTSTVSMATNIIGGITNFTISFIFAIYILGQKERLCNQSRRIVTAYLPERYSNTVLKVSAMLHKNFCSFVTGQCLEAVILGTMFVIAMSIFKMPYAFMIGVLIAFTALIPVIGAFIGCVVGAFLILIDSPVLAVWFVVLFLVLQQIEGNLIYPKVVGSSVGLPSMWVLAAVTLGGSLFGIAGMLFFIPLSSTAYALLRESVNSRNAIKERAARERLEQEKERDNDKENLISDSSCRKYDA